MKKTLFFIIGINILINLFYINKIEFSTCSNLNIQGKNVEGDSMFPLLENSSKIDLLIDYYNVCDKKVKKGDLVAYNYAGNDLALIKIVKVNDKDFVEIKGSNLIVNGKILVNSVGEKYSFTEKQLNMLSLYITDKKIPTGSYFIFGDNIENSIDSRKFGAVGQTDFLGKFRIKNSK